MDYKKKFFFAFTLAEVLITMGIIGIVAEITLPPLVRNIQDAQYKAAAKKAFTVISQAVTQMRQDEGGTLVQYHQMQHAFEPIFITYLKGVTPCPDTGCIVDSATTDYQTLGKAETVNWWWGQQFETNDGMFWGIMNNGTWPTNVGTETIVFLVDVNGYRKKPNMFGRDVFLFELLNDRVLPMGAEGTNVTEANKCERNTGWWRSGLGCMINVMQGIDY